MPELYFAVAAVITLKKTSTCYNFQTFSKHILFAFYIIKVSKEIYTTNTQQQANIKHASTKKTQQKIRGRLQPHRCTQNGTQTI
eukprot:scaffold1973_cov92-Skeletonema_dohrnii-CCMP3373.AAC.4